MSIVVIGGTMMPGEANHGEAGPLLGRPSRTRRISSDMVETRAGAAPTAPAVQGEIVSTMSDVPLLPPGIRSSRRIPPPDEMVAPVPDPFEPGERVYFRWPALDDNTRLHHSTKRTRAGRVTQVLVGVQFDDEVEPMFLPSSQWSRALAIDWDWD